MIGLLGFGKTQAQLIKYGLGHFAFGAAAQRSYFQFYCRQGRLREKYADLRCFDITLDSHNNNMAFFTVIDKNIKKGIPGDLDSWSIIFWIITVSLSFTLFLCYFITSLLITGEA